MFLMQRPCSIFSNDPGERKQGGFFQARERNRFADPVIDPLAEEG